jgi:hypothetical protein
LIENISCSNLSQNFNITKTKILHISKLEPAKNIWGQNFPHQSPQKGKETKGHDGHGPWLNNFSRNSFIGPLAHLATTTTTTTLATTMKTIIYIF